MMRANETRGESTISLEGVDYVMRPSHEAIDAFEQATGKSVMQLYRAAADDGLKLSEIAAIAGECLRAAGRSLSTVAAHFKDQRIAELMLEEDGGLLLASRRVAIMLLMAGTGGVTASGEPKALATTSPTLGQESEGSQA